MKFKIATLLLILPMISNAASSHCSQLRIAIVDTGLNLKDPRFKNHLCKTGHKDFTGEGLTDVNGHGTHIAGLIEKYAKNTNYCILVYKYYQEFAPEYITSQRERMAMEEAVYNGADIVNFSGGGAGFDENEALLIKDHPEVTFVVAAGNDGNNLDMPDNEYYPASLFYENMAVVGSLDENGNRAPSSNYSERIKYHEVGENVLSYLPGGEVGRLSGTSQATAIYSGKLVAKKLKTCKYR